MEVACWFRRVGCVPDIFGAAAIFATLAATASAAEPSGWHLWPGVSLNPPCMMCPDDYCPKPCPTLCPVCCFGPNDYCCKPLPCLMPVKCCGPNDYCCKPSAGHSAALPDAELHLRATTGLQLLRTTNEIPKGNPQITPMDTDFLSGAGGQAEP